MLLVKAGYVVGQENEYPRIPTVGDKVTDFISTDWVLIDSVSGDLNKDNYSDIAFIIKNDSLYPNNDLKQRHFLVVVAFDDDIRRLKLIGMTGKLFLPQLSERLLFYEEMEINKGILSLSFYRGGRVDIITHYKFRYQENNFCLIGADRKTFNLSNQDFKNYSFNFLTKKWSLTSGNDTSDAKPTVEWGKLEFKELKTFKTYEGPFTWEVANGIYL